jgi:ribosome biogenesis GTPase
VGRPVCGDRVRVEAEERQTAVVSAIEPRRNTFARADGNQRMQTIAANLDHVLIVLAPEPAPSRDLLERYLVAVHSLAIEPVIVINKVERLEEDETRKVGPLSRLAEYEDLGYSVVPTSCKTAPGVEGLRSVLRGHISILVGQSGVGKSSLVNHLVPDLEIQTGALSTSTGKGRHTTTSTMMYSLPVQDGRLIDSPGVWEYGLWELSRAELESGFIEFRPFLGDCRFNNCAHDSEPGCAIKAAVEAGAIKSWRHDSYKRLLAQQQA